MAHYTLTIGRLSAISFALNGEIRIHYEVEGDGDPLVMVDGFSTSLEMWREQGYTEDLAASHQLILIDARGHGQSDKPHDSAQYRPELMVADVVTVLDHLGVEKAHYMGASMGAAIGFEIARHAPGRLRSLILMGYGRYGPLTEAQQQFQAVGRRMQEMAVAIGAEAALAAVERMAGPRSPENRARFIANFLANDQRALLAFLNAFDEWPGFEDVLPGITVSCLVMVTEGDPFYTNAKKCAELMPRATFVPLVGGVHTQTSYEAEIVVPHIKNFLMRRAPGSDAAAGVYHLRPCSLDGLQAARAQRRCCQVGSFHCREAAILRHLKCSARGGKAHPRPSAFPSPEASRAQRVSCVGPLRPSATDLRRPLRARRGGHSRLVCQRRPARRRRDFVLWRASSEGTDGGEVNHAGCPTIGQ